MGILSVKGVLSSFSSAVVLAKWDRFTMLMHSEIFEGKELYKSQMLLLLICLQATSKTRSGYTSHCPNTHSIPVLLLMANSLNRLDKENFRDRENQEMPEVQQ